MNYWVLLVCLLLAAMGREACCSLQHSVTSASKPLELFVNCSSDKFSRGTPLHFSSLNAARDYIRTLPRPLTRNITVKVFSNVDQPCHASTPTSPILQLDNPSRDSGEAPNNTLAHPIFITYESVDSFDKTVLTGGIKLDAKTWKKSPNSDIYVYNLSTINFGPLGIGEFGGGGLGTCVPTRVELFFEGMPMIIARYPNVNSLNQYNGPWMNWAHVSGTDPSAAFSTENKRAKKWHQEFSLNPLAFRDCWLHGFWSFDWADNYIQFQNISKQPKETPIKNADEEYQIHYNPRTPPVYGIKEGARFYLVNLLSELDVPGEYFIDKEKLLLYFWPPSSIENSEAVLSVNSAASLIEINGPVSYVRFRKLLLQYGRGSGILRTSSPTQLKASVEIFRHDQPDKSGKGILQEHFPQTFSSLRSATNLGSNHLVFEDLKIVNFGRSAIGLDDVSYSSIQNLNSSGLGCAAVSMAGGNTLYLTESHNVIVNSQIKLYARWTRTYNPGIRFAGVGIQVTGNSVADAPHQGMTGSGNNHIFLNNFFANLCFEVRDSGAWYVGRSWVDRGMQVLKNTFVNITALEPTKLGSAQVQAIYLDDEQSGVEISGNICRYSDNCMLIGGGRDNNITNNSCQHLHNYCVLFDNRGMNWQRGMCTYNNTYRGQLVEQLFAVNYQQPPYSVAYPRITSTLSFHPCVPVENAFEANTFCDVTFGFIDEGNITIQSWYSTLQNNHEEMHC